MEEKQKILNQEIQYYKDVGNKNQIKIDMIL